MKPLDILSRPPAKPDEWRRPLMDASGASSWGSPVRCTLCRRVAERGGFPATRMNWANSYCFSEGCPATQPWKGVGEPLETATDCIHLVDHAYNLYRGIEEPDAAGAAWEHPYPLYVLYALRERRRQERWASE